MRAISMMSIVLLSMTLCLSIGSQVPDDPKIKEAQVIAERWLSSLDSQDYERCYKEAATEYTAGFLNLHNFTMVLQGDRRPLGMLAKRELVRASYCNKFKGQPGLEGVSLRFKSQFSQRADVVEILSVFKDKDGAWRVHGYIVTNDSASPPCLTSSGTGPDDGVASPMLFGG
jgi:hypothetical protein